MEYNIHGLFLETTRRCNMCCDHCMRGDAQNLDLTKELVDEIFDKLRGVSIERLVFTGGEPTLNPDVIVYTIDKIMKEKISIGYIQMVTNGLVFNEEIAKSFDKYNLYCLRECTLSDYDAIGDVNYRLRHAIVAISRDEHHDPIDRKIRTLYHSYAPHTLIKQHIVPEKRIIKTGRSKYGKEFTYKLKGIPYQIDTELRVVNTPLELYLSANGLINNSPDGSYEDMDRINFGSIHDFSLERLLCNYGTSMGSKETLRDFTGKPRMMIPNQKEDK